LIIKYIFKNKSESLSIFSKPGFYDWIGDHRPTGIVFMYGKNIKINKKINANVIDIVPTILAAMNLPISDYIDGSVIEEVFVNKPKIKKIKKEEEKYEYLTEFELKKIKKLRLNI